MFPASTAAMLAEERCTRQTHPADARMCLIRTYTPCIVCLAPAACHRAMRELARTPPARASSDAGMWLQGYCGKVVIDSFDPGILKAPYTCTPIDFDTVEEADLHDIEIPLAFTCKGPCVVHGVACWFDVQFPGTAQPMWLSTAPGMAATHWFQLRCALQVRRPALPSLSTSLRQLCGGRGVLRERWRGRGARLGHRGHQGWGLRGNQAWSGRWRKGEEGSKAGSERQEGHRLTRWGGPGGFEVVPSLHCSQSRQFPPASCPCASCPYRCL